MKAVGAGLILLLLIPVAAGPQGAPPPGDEFETRIRPLFTAYCISCHGPRKKKAGVDLAAARSEADLARDPETWLKAIHQLKTRSMPPEDERQQPTEAEREALVAWLEAAADRMDERAPRDPGRVTLRRLNRAEYTNTIRDLVGLDLQPAEDFPADDVSDGFDTLGDVLTLPPLLLEKYLDAAGRVLDQAMIADGPVTLLQKKLEGAALGKNPREMRFEEEFTAALEVPADGRYQIRVRAGQLRGPDGATVLAVKVDGVDSALLAIRSAPDVPEVHAATVALQAGPRKVSFRHTPPRAYKKEETVPDARLALDWIELAGPERSLSHRRIFFAEGSDRATARTILERFATRAFRRPVAADELDRLAALYDAARGKGKSFAAAVRTGLWSILVSPHFLFRVERDTADRDAHGAVRLSDWELASRLSYFLWSSMPDEPLLALAARGKLRDPEVLREQSRRMLADPRAAALVENFAGQWLGLRRLDQVHPDRDLFPSFTASLRRAMHDEASLFIANLVREDRSILELLDADYSYLNEPLARHYGIKDVKGDALRRVALPDGRRGGVMTMAAILTITSHPTRTSAVKRGKWILDEILGAPPPPPPPNVPELEQATQNRPDAAMLSLRQRMELHRADPQCFGCHKRMDVLGLGFENFDPIGRWRDRDGSRSIDVAGKLPTGEAFKGPAELKKILAACKDDFARTLAEKMFVFALGRSLQRADRREVRQVVENLKQKDWRVSALVEGVVASYPFRHRRPADGVSSRETPK